LAPFLMLSKCKVKRVLRDPFTVRFKQER